MILTTQFNLVYKLDCISRIEQGHVRQNVVIAEPLGQFDGGQRLFIDLPLDLRNADDHLHCLAFLDALAHPQQVALVDDSAFAHLLVRLIADAVLGSPR